jgi:hypothetical protein
VKSKRTSARVFEHLQRGVGARGFDDAKAVFFKCVGREHAQERVVFHYEDHWLCLAHESRTQKRASMFLC